MIHRYGTPTKDLNVELVSGGSTMRRNESRCPDCKRPNAILVPYGLERVCATCAQRRDLTNPAFQKTVWEPAPEPESSSSRPERPEF
jgi:hypothetical protein